MKTYREFDIDEDERGRWWATLDNENGYHLGPFDSEAEAQRAVDKNIEDSRGEGDY